MTVVVGGGILAGGLSRRMAGKEKGLVVVNGEAMAAHIARTLNPYVSELLINANRFQTDYEKFCGSVVNDQISGFKGPLAGIHALLRATKDEYLLLSSCDTPYLTSEYPQKMLERLNQELTRGHQPGIICAKSEDKLHPLHCVVSKALISDLEGRLSNDQLKVMDWIRAYAELQTVDFDGESRTQFRNLNSPEDF